MKKSNRTAKALAVLAALVFTTFGAYATDEPAQVPSNTPGGAGSYVAQMRCQNVDGHRPGTAEFEQCVLDRLEQTPYEVDGGGGGSFLSQLRTCRRQGLTTGTKEWAVCIAGQI